MAINRERMRRHLPSGAFVAVGAAIVLVLLAVLVYAGVYNIAADVPHTRPVHGFLDTVRDRSIAAHAVGSPCPPI